jgi:hypothetical protein
LPHSEIVGLQLGSSSPTLIAAAHVLLRHSTPRHPPHACSSFFLCPPSQQTTIPDRLRAVPCPSPCVWSNSVKSQPHSSHGALLARPRALPLPVSPQRAFQSRVRGLVVMSLQLLRYSPHPRLRSFGRRQWARCCFIPRHGVHTPHGATGSLLIYSLFPHPFKTRRWQ